MPQEYTPSGSPIPFTVPAYADVVDGPVAFKAFADDLHTGLAAKLDSASAVQAITNASPYTPQLQFVSKSVDANSGFVMFMKDRGGGVVQNGDTLGQLAFKGFDGAASQNAAMIAATVAGTPGANDMPGALSLYTTADGTATLAERLRIGADGSITGTGSLGGWVGYTPTFTSQFTLGNGTSAGCWCRLGKTVHTRGVIVFGTTTAFGTGAGDSVQLTLPSTMSSYASKGRIAIAMFVDASAGMSYPCIGGPISDTQIALTFGTANTSYVTGGGFNNSIPVAPAAGDTLSWFMTYEEV